MASIAVRLSAQTGQLVDDFGKAEQLAEGFKNRLTAIGKATAQSFSGARASFNTTARELGNIASVAAASTAVLSKFTKGNKEMQERLEQATVTLAIAAPAIRGFGSALRLATGPIGLVITAIGAAILVMRNWEAISRAVTDTAARVWAKLGEFFMGLWGGLGQAAAGLGQILLGALTLDVARIQEGYQQMVDGFTAVKDTMVTAAVGIASGVGAAVTKLMEMASALTDVKEKTIQSVAELNPLMTQLNAIQSAELQALETGRLMFEEQQQRAAEAQAAAQVAAVQADQDFQSQLAAIHSALLQELEAGTATFQEQQAAAAEVQAAFQAQLTAELQSLGTVLLGLFGQQKLAAIATAIINTYLGVTRALAAFPPPLSFIMAAKVLAFGLAQVAVIRGTALAHGGIVTQPIRPLIGEAGPEAVIPLSGPRGRAALAELGGRGDLIAHFHFDGHELAKIVVPLIPGIVRVQAGIRSA